MTRRMLSVSVLTCLIAVIPVSAATVDLDVVFASNGGTPMVFDDFSDGAIFPPWLTLSGAPGPEAGTTLPLHTGDTIFTPMVAEPGLLALSLADLTDFGGGSVYTMFVAGDTPGDLLALAVTPVGSVLVDESGIIGAVAFDPGTSATMIIASDPASGLLLAFVNTELIYLGANTLGSAIGVGFNVVPEPTSLALLALGAVALVRRKRQ